MTGRWAVPGPALLFCPGHRPDRFDKALAAADGVILDLEDAVGPGDKDAARAAVVQALDRIDPARVVVRVNAPGTAWFDADVAALAGHPDVAVMVPMVTSPAQLEAVAPHPAIGLCETAAGVLAAAGVALAANCVGLMWGSEDLVADLRGRPGRAPTGTYWPAVEFARSTVLYAARAAGVEPLDTVFVGIDDVDTLRSDSAAAAASGFAAKVCIHPKQVGTVRAAYAPAAEDLRWARAALDAARTQPGAFRFEGRMVDEPVLAHARALLQRAPISEEVR